MDLALKAAETAGKSGEVPIGCVIVLNNEVIATAGNRTLTDRDPTAHAEILAIRQATAAVGSERLVDCDLYVTLEPCTMCAGAISLARIRRLYYGAADPKGGAVDSGVQVLRIADLPSRRPKSIRRWERAKPQRCCGIFSRRGGSRPGCHHPRKRMIQYSRDDDAQSKGLGVLDTPLSRVMTK